MSDAPVMKGFAVAVAVVALATVAACGNDDPVSTGVPCTLPTANPAAVMPAGLPPIEGQVLYEPSTQGKTEIVFGLLKTSDFVKVRDDYVAQLTAGGWKNDGTDQESVEAEAQFSKATPLQTGTVKVAPLETCKGYVTVRFKANL